MVAEADAEAIATGVGSVQQRAVLRKSLDHSLVFHACSHIRTYIHACIHIYNCMYMYAYYTYICAYMSAYSLMRMSI